MGDAIKYAVLEQGGNLSTLRTWDAVKCRMAPPPAPPEVSRPSTVYYFTTLPLILRLGRVTGDVVQVSPLSTLQPDALVLQVLSLLALLVLSLLALLLNTAA